MNEFKLYKLILGPIFIGIIVFIIYLISNFYHSANDIDGFFIGYNSTYDNAFIGSIEYNIGDDTTIVLPEEYEGIKINELGGYIGRGYPCPFTIEIINLEELYPSDQYEITCCSYDLIDYFTEQEEYDTINFLFHIVLPPTLEEVVYCDFNYNYVIKSLDENETSKTIVYHFITEFEISEDNEYFYTKDGKLYNKSNDELIDEFIYE